MTTKIKGTEGVEFPDATQQATAADAGPAFSAQNITPSTNIPASGITPWPHGYVEVFDTNNSFNPTTGRFQPTIAGYYMLGASIVLGGGAGAGTFVGCNIIKNGTNFAGMLNSWPAPDRAYCGVANPTLVYLNGSTDYAEAGFGANNAASTPVQISDGGVNFYGFLARRAAP